MPSEQLVPVSQEDREAAVRIMADRWHAKHRAGVLAGDCDHWIRVQECARQYRRGIADAAKVLHTVEPDEEVAGCPATWPDFVQVAESVILAIGRA